MYHANGSYPKIFWPFLFDSLPDWLFSRRQFVLPLKTMLTLLSSVIPLWSRYVRGLKMTVRGTMVRSDVTPGVSDWGHRSSISISWHFTFYISWHFTFHDIWHFMTFDISWHLIFNDIWHFFDISWCLTCYLTFHDIWHFISSSSRIELLRS